MTSAQRYEFARAFAEGIDLGLSQCGRKKVSQKEVVRQFFTAFRKVCAPLFITEGVVTLRQYFADLAAEGAKIPAAKQDRYDKIIKKVVALYSKKQSRQRPK